MGRKRNYVEAGFASPEPQPETSAQPATENAEASQPVKKKRIRKSAKKYKKAAAAAAEGTDLKGEDTTDKKSSSNAAAPPGAATGANAVTSDMGNPQRSEKKVAKLEKTAAIKKHRSNKRREERVAQRQSDTMCYGCRQKGHSVDRCPQNDGGQKQSMLCYRCGSTTHSLKQCRKPRPKDGVDLPYASCFICNNKGHLAGQCERNERGVYPRGGECKICKSVEHLAKDCPVRSDQEKEAKRPALVVGTGQMGGNADEDDFHVLATRKSELEMKEKAIKSAKTPLTAPKPKKVVGF